MQLSIFGIISILLIWGAAIYLSIKTAILKDINTGGTGTYSLAKTQLLWWTLIIITCFIVALDSSSGKIFPDLNSTVVTLLGISLGTTATSKIIDGQLKVQGKRAQSAGSRSFIHDILSDENGISVHRFQTVIFNIIFGIAFFIEFTQNGSFAFPDYDTSQLAVLGISSAGYIALKMNENGEKHQNVPLNTTQKNTPVAPPTQQVPPTPPVQPVAPTPPTTPQTPPTTVIPPK
jgi:hypothetical protein